MAMDDSIGISLDYEGYRRDLDAIGRAALPDAAAGMLNNAAFAAQSRLTAHVEQAFDRPRAFTSKAFMVRKANPRDKETMASQVFAKDAQAAYLRLQIEGGLRGPDDPGARGAHDVFGYAVRTDKYGGIPRGFTEALTKEKEKEQRKRMMFAATRSELRLKHRLEMDRREDAEDERYASLENAEKRVKAQSRLTVALFTGPSGGPIGDAFDGKKAEKQRKAVLAAAKKRRAAQRAVDKAARRSVTEAGPSYDRTHTPGLFFGTIHGVSGYWRRPKRVAGKSGSPTLLLRVQADAEYKPRFRYNEVIQQAFREFVTDREFARELDRASIKAIERSAARAAKRAADKVGTAAPDVPTVPTPDVAPPTGGGGSPGFRRPAFMGGERITPSSNGV